jgi:hypothetical protein
LLRVVDVTVTFSIIVLLAAILAGQEALSLIVTGHQALARLVANKLYAVIGGPAVTAEHQWIETLLRITRLGRFLR